MLNLFLIVRVLFDVVVLAAVCGHPQHRVLVEPALILLRGAVLVERLEEGDEEDVHVRVGVAVGRRVLLAQLAVGVRDVRDDRVLDDRRVHHDRAHLLLLGARAIAVGDEVLVLEPEERHVVLARRDLGEAHVVAVGVPRLARAAVVVGHAVRELRRAVGAVLVAEGEAVPLRRPGAAGEVHRRAAVRDDGAPLAVRVVLEERVVVERARVARAREGELLARELHAVSRHAVLRQLELRLVARASRLEIPQAFVGQPVELVVGKRVRHLLGERRERAALVRALDVGEAVLVSVHVVDGLSVCHCFLLRRAEAARVDVLRRHLLKGVRVLVGRPLPEVAELAHGDFLLLALGLGGRDRREPEVTAGVGRTHDAERDIEARFAFEVHRDRPRSTVDARRVVADVAVGSRDEVARASIALDARAVRIIVDLGLVEFDRFVLVVLDADVLGGRVRLVQVVEGEGELVERHRLVEVVAVPERERQLRPRIAPDVDLREAVHAPVGFVFHAVRVAGGVGREIR